MRFRNDAVSLLILATLFGASEAVGLGVGVSTGHLGGSVGVSTGATGTSAGVSTGHLGGASVGASTGTTGTSVGVSTGATGFSASVGASADDASVATAAVNPTRSSKRLLRLKLRCQIVRAHPATFDHDLVRLCEASLRQKVRFVHTPSGILAAGNAH